MKCNSSDIDEEDFKTVIEALHLLYSSSLWQEKDKSYKDGLAAIDRIQNRR